MPIKIFVIININRIETNKVEITFYEYVRNVKEQEGTFYFSIKIVSMRIDEILPYAAHIRTVRVGMVRQPFWGHKFAMYEFRVFSSEFEWVLKDLHLA